MLGNSPGSPSRAAECRFDAQEEWIQSSLRDNWFPGVLDTAPVLTSIMADESHSSGLPDVVLFCSYLKSLDVALSEATDRQSFVFIFFCPWGPPG